ncbi:CIA30 family protein [Planctomycetota bacterium]
MMNHAIDATFAFLASAAVVSLVAVASPLHAAGKGQVLFSSENPGAGVRWIAVNDGVMGGVSKGGVRFADDGVLVFSGTLSLENRGGFASIRSVQDPIDLSGNEGLAVRVRGDGRRYWLTVKTDRWIMAGSYRVEFDTTPGEWTEIRTPFADFRATSFGRELPNVPPPDPTKLSSIGFLIADKKAGPFSLQVASIKAYRAGATRKAAGPPVDAGARKPRDIVDTAVAAGNFKLLVAALKAADLVSTLKGDGPFTVFAPTDGAFAKLPEGVVAELLQPGNRKRLVSVLTNHVIPGRVILRQERSAGKTLEGSELTVASAGSFQVNGVKVLTEDIEASNGVIHIVDAVLLPASFGTAKPKSAARLIELAIDKGVPLFNSGNVEACKAVYEVTAEALLRLPPEELREQDRARVEEALKRTRKGGTAREHAWLLRRALDSAYVGALRRPTQ